MLRGLVGLVVVVLFVVHGYFYLFFGTLDPCTAATFKVMNEGQPDAAALGGLMFSAAIEKTVRSKGLLTCYRIAITGEAPGNLR